jgi:hypothetical protein
VSSSQVIIPNQLVIEFCSIVLPVVFHHFLFRLERVHQPVFATFFVTRDRSEWDFADVDMNSVDGVVIPVDNFVEWSKAVVLEAVVSDGAVSDVSGNTFERVDAGAEAAVTREHNVIPNRFA